ncbi:MAG TPA: hypothetical protein VGX91_08910 [Candidatus Cybelea sp.]|nr:hypothetical protein [Candidatus Cybelea sp.]
MAVAATVLSACGGVLSSTGAPGGVAPSGYETGLTALSVQRVAALTMPHYVPRPVRTDRGKSWMSPLAHRSDLLYVSDWATNDVYVYSYPGGGAVGTLTGLDEPYGQCVDKTGNIYITNMAAGTTEKYAHGGTSPIATYSDTGSPIGCAVDKSGDLAVTNFTSVSGPGSIDVWPHGGGGPVTHSDSSACYYMWPAGYDKKDDLVAEGEYSSNAICELPTGAGSMRTVSFSGTINFPGGTMWDGKYLALTDQEAGGVYQTALYPSKLSGTTLTEVTSAVLNDSCYSTYSDVVSPFIVGLKNTPANTAQDGAVVGSNLWCAEGSGGSKVECWAYPTGGTSIWSLSSPPSEPEGQSVSIHTSAASVQRAVRSTCDSPI